MSNEAQNHGTNGESLGSTLDALHISASLLSKLAAECAAHQVRISLARREDVQALVAKLRDSLGTIEEELLLLKHERDWQAQRESDERARISK